jgi:tetratricopeptide (TPR) repeat protein
MEDRMKRSVFLISLLFFTSFTLGRAQSDTVAFRAAVAVQNSSGRISALVQFLDQFPRSFYRSAAYNTLFGLYVDQGSEPQALDAATHYLQTLPPEARMGPYNQFAYSLAVKNMGLDSALVYAALAEEMAKGEGVGTLGPIQDTRAFVLYRKGDVAAAEKLQGAAIRGHEDDPEYVGHLALYQERNGKRRVALSTISRAIYTGGDPEMQARFLEWLAREEKDGKRRQALKDSIVMKTVHSYVDTLRGVKAVAARSNAAAFMARMSVNLPTARKFAEAATRSLAKNSPVEDAVMFKQNLAMVTAAEGKSRDALVILRSIEDLVSPWSTDFWMTLGSLYQNLGKPENAVTAYMNGLTAISSKQLRDSLEAVYRKLHGSIDGLDAGLDRLKQSGAAFDPGQYAPEGRRTGKVMLAELFTGAECGPCVASDIAFDALGEYYPRTEVEILEYHVHIPGPDPLTTNDSWSRYQMYRGGGTPTVVIDGRESIVGGGPKYIARNRFNLYRYAIQKYKGDEPGMILTIDVLRRHDSIAVAAHVRQIRERVKEGNCVLHIALVERSVDYTGGNGISRHAMVVRGLFGGAAGTPVSSNLPEETLQLTLDIAAVEAGIRDLLRDPKSQPSWPGRKRNFSGWRSVPRDIDSSNLTVVAWIQDAVTHEVLQSVSEDVPSGMSAD